MKDTFIDVKTPAEGYWHPSGSKDIGGGSEYGRIAAEIAKLVEEKDKAYGKAFDKGGDFLKILFPNGIPVEKYCDMLAIIRIFDKFMRIATDAGAFGENPWNDINGYSLLSIKRLQNKER